MSDSPEPISAKRRAEAVEAVLFVGGAPLKTEDYQKAFPEAPSEELSKAVDMLRARYAEEHRPYGIVEVDGGYLMQLHGGYRQELAEKMMPARPAKLSRAVIDVLSVVAYRQPISKADVDELVGLDCSASLRQLVRRGLITTVESESSQGENPISAYVTAERFLGLFRLESLEDLPVSEDLNRL